MENLGMYCLCFQGREPKRHQFDQRNLMCGSANYDPTEVARLLTKGFVMDNTGDNISDTNRDFGNLTGLYWVWKNTKHEFKGTNTYRLFWDGDFELEPNLLYIPKTVDITKSVSGVLSNPDIITHFNHCHDPFGVSWKLLKSLAVGKKIPITENMIDSLNNHRYLVPFHIFTSDYKTFDKLCDILFGILFEFQIKFSDALPELYQKTGQIRLYDFFSERLFHLIMANGDYFLKGTNIRFLDICDISHNAPPL